MYTIKLKYQDSNGDVFSKSYSVLALRGFDNPDVVQFVPPIVNRFMDGSSQTQFVGFQRVITVDFGVVSSSVDRRFILSFMQGKTRSIIYQNSEGLGEIPVVPENGLYENEWLDGVEYARSYVLSFSESVVSKRWQPYIPIPDPLPVQTVDIMYIKNKVKIEGTQASPETFTTNAGKLLTDETGSVYPSISLLTYAVTVMCNATPYQPCMINLVSPVSNAGSDLTFQLARSTDGSAAGDGYYYADIIIGVQLRP